MPAKRKTRRDRVGDALLRRYKAGKAMAELTEEEVAQALGYGTRKPMRQRREDPMRFTIGDLLTLETILGWSLEDWLYILRAEEIKGGRA